MSQGPAPARSWNGDAELILDSGEKFRVHSLLLESSSSIFGEALLSAPASVPGERIGLRLPGVSGEQAVLFVQMLYNTFDMPAWLKARTCEELYKLAAVCYALACNELLASVDSALMDQADSTISAANALDTYVQAHTHHLKGLQELSTKSLVQLLPQLKLPAAEDGADADQLHVPVLREIQRVQEEQAETLHLVRQVLQEHDFTADGACGAISQALDLLE